MDLASSATRVIRWIRWIIVVLCKDTTKFSRFCQKSQEPLPNNTNNHFPDLLLSQFHYELPEDRIARHPLEVRDQARLLRFQGGNISHHHFYEVPDLLDSGDLLVFNDTRVIPARLFFRRDSGALIEVVLLHPLQPAEVSGAMLAQGSCSWECIVGNKKKWKPGEVLELRLGGDPEVRLRARLEDREQMHVSFSWEPASLTWADVLLRCGDLPLPPYLNREAEESDYERYQTVYARRQGAVAAPTAGLHFTDAVLEGLKHKGIAQAFVTLHVSAGTFLPVRTDRIAEHPMHAEQIVITRTMLAALLSSAGRVIAVGTTSLRWIESVCRIGDKILQNPNYERLPELGQFDPYQGAPEETPGRVALEALAAWMDARGLETVTAETRLLIVPGYRFRLVQGLITNYHLPETTLMLLVAAFIGPRWREVYASALENGYRFLSYGDSSLLLP
ncbi:MAG: S-adenosylmethionine:tRNA ribosyltransferase-isomerase [Bacteroidetes bacterium]|nr:MAG: S-adenosylmethionine:tRNA ribosyltransferase-isomerase [Bacteroidota bacterium]